MGLSNAGGMNVLVKILVGDRRSHLRCRAVVYVNEPKLARMSAVATQYYSSTGVSDVDSGGCVSGCEPAVAEHTDG